LKKGTNYKPQPIINIYLLYLPLITRFDLYNSMVCIHRLSYAPFLIKLQIEKGIFFIYIKINHDTLNIGTSEWSS